MALSKVTCSWMLIIYCGNICSSFARDCSEDYDFDPQVAGEGSNGIVVKATSSSETIAIKFPRRGHLRKELRILEYFTNETKGNDGLNDDCNKAVRAEHCNFVKFLGTCDIHGEQSIKLEYLEVLLTDVLCTTYSTMPDFLTYAFHLLQAVETLQRIKIVHGDLHPANIGFGADGALKLFDFGNSYRMENPSRSMTCAPDFASPESFLFEDILERSQSDTYSVGVTIYEMFTGQRFINGRFMVDYESCERTSREVTWENNKRSVCSGRAYYHVARLHRCSAEVWECAVVYREIEEKLERLCRPNNLCISQLRTSLDTWKSARRIESFLKDEERRIERAGASKADLVEILTGVLSFDYTKRMTPQAAKSLKIFNVFNLPANF